MNTYQILSLAGIPTLVGIIIAILIKRPLEKRVAESERIQATQQQQSQAIMLGVQSLLRDRLLQAYRHYAHQGWANYDDRQNVLNMYTQYEALGPNSVMDQYHQRFMQLPNEPINTEGGNEQ